MSEMFSIELDGSEEQEVGDTPAEDEVVEEDSIDLSELVDSIPSSIASELSMPEVVVQVDKEPLEDEAQVVEEAHDESEITEADLLLIEEEADEERTHFVENFMDEAFALEQSVDAPPRLKDKPLSEIKISEPDEEELTEVEIDQLLEAVEPVFEEVEEAVACFG